MRIVMCNLWLFHPLVSRIMANRHTTAPTIRTTTALTIVKGGVKSNVLPSTATAVVNHRSMLALCSCSGAVQRACSVCGFRSLHAVHPLDTLESVLAHDRSVIADKRVKMEVRLPADQFLRSWVLLRIERSCCGVCFPDH